MFLAPGVTPWKTTLPGVTNGANNPGIRVIDYDPDTLQVLVGDPQLLHTAPLGYFNASCSFTVTTGVEQLCRRGHQACV